MPGYCIPVGRHGPTIAPLVLRSDCLGVTADPSGRVINLTESTGRGPSFDIGSWLGSALAGQLLAHQAHLLILHTLTAIGYPRATFHAHCAIRLYRPVNTGVTHFARALKLTCWISQQVTGD